MQAAVPWPHDFPHAAHFTDTTRFVAHPLFKPAKRGDYKAALALVSALADWSYCDMLVAHSRPRALAAVLSDESGGNQLPAALAEAFGDRYNLPLLPVAKAPGPRRTKTSAWERICHRPTFLLKQEPVGICRMARILMLDDVITTGGSLSELRLFLWQHDLWAVAAAVIAATPSRARQEDGTRLAPRAATMRKLRDIVPDIAARLSAHGIYNGEPGCLTESEAQSLIAASSDARDDQAGAAPPRRRRAAAEATAQQPSTGAPAPQQAAR